MKHIDNWLKQHKCTYIHLTKVITVHPTFWQLLWKIKTRPQWFLFYTKEESLPKSLRVILLQQDAQFLKWRCPNKGTLVSKSHILTKIYDNFDFDIVNFPFLDGDVPRRTSYGVYISQLIRFARASSSVSDCNCRNKPLTAKLLRQGYRYHKLRKSFSVLVLS